MRPRDSVEDDIKICKIVLHLLEIVGRPVPMWLFTYSIVQNFGSPSTPA
jgi:hypothetical protein